MGRPPSAAPDTGASAAPWALSSLLAGGHKDPGRGVRVHAQLSGHVYPVLKSMKAESRNFFNRHVPSTSTTLAQSYVIVSGVTRSATIEWLMNLRLKFVTLGVDRFDRHLLWKAISYLDGFYSSAARSNAWAGAGYSQERAFAACLLAWKINKSGAQRVGFVTGFMADKMDVRLDISLVLRIEMELVSMLDFQVSSPSVLELAEAVEFYLRLLGSPASSMCAKVTAQLAHVLVTDEDIAGSVEPVSIVLAAAVLSFRLCDTPAVISAYLEEEIYNMFDEPNDPARSGRICSACAERRALNQAGCRCR
eukprot:TRINITY_DN14105_c2_g6_i1.p1 TRINITY_DN14105_c2_g6~~TRINITY_DN14105_c2_g6_i1.p1  ORF type:complete len:307 (+),score=22.87 TRINITY_DN14105_c2_g6_i1:80-1000(+)